MDRKKEIDGIIDGENEKDTKKFKTVHEGDATIQLSVAWVTVVHHHNGFLLNGYYRGQLFHIVTLDTGQPVSVIRY